jgi:hypothetical protein
MSLFYKSIHKIDQLSFFDSVKNFAFNHAKVSLELIYSDGLVGFYIVTYKQYSKLIAQQVTSNYPDAEVKIIKKDEYVDIKPPGYTIQAIST